MATQESKHAVQFQSIKTKQNFFVPPFKSLTIKNMSSLIFKVNIIQSQLLKTVTSSPNLALLFPKFYSSGKSLLEVAYENAHAYCKGNFKIPYLLVINFNLLIHQLTKFMFVLFGPVTGKKPPPDVEIDGVFATNELDLRQVKVYGFDYDYTLACYKESVDHLIYNLGRETLVHKLRVRNLLTALS